MCFPSLYRNDKQCRLQCQEEDTIEHTFYCHKIKHPEDLSTVNFNAIFASVKDKEQAVSKLIRLHSTRSAILVAYQGFVLDTAAPALVGGAREGP